MNSISGKKIRHKKIRHKPPTPYWNFWKVVFAGWLIRYPKTFMRVIGIPIGIIFVYIYNASRWKI